jgi:NAD(P)-dependent dehydrogenase (short-subunit alcohol dehydrogenase family)
MVDILYRNGKHLIWVFRGFNEPGVLFRITIEIYHWARKVDAGIFMSLKEKVAVITGATGALGKVATKALLEQDAIVVSTYSSREKPEELNQFVGGHSEKLMQIQSDVTDEASVQNLMQKALEKHGHIDILLNIVGAHIGGAEVTDLKVSDWDFMMNVNLKSAFLCCKAALPYMIRQNYGKIINISARPAIEKRYRAKNCAYTVSKAGVLVLTETIAEEVKKYNMNVNCIIPSTIDTEANRRNMPDADFSKWVKPEDITKVIMCLVSDDSKVTSGAAIPVYGKA